MSIQFCCPQCQQPIEVDDEHAGRVAACPYCHHHVTVPAESTYHPQQTLIARPAAPGASTGYGADQQVPPQYAGPAPIPVRSAPSAGPVDPIVLMRQQRARRYGNYALICAAIVVLAVAVGTIRAATVLMRSPGFSHTSTTLSPQLQKEILQDRWYVGSAFVMLLASMVGVALAIPSLFQHSRGNWQAIVSVVICGLCLLCNCGAGLFANLLGLPSP